VFHVQRAAHCNGCGRAAKAGDLTMLLNRYARRVLDMLAVSGQSKGRYDDVAERRQSLTALAELVDPPGAVAVAGVRDMLMRVDDGVITLRTYSPLDEPAARLPGMMFFHGGGGVAGSLETHDGLCRRLANESGCRVVAVDYRLAPEHPFPSGLNDCVAALRHVASHADAFGIDARRLGVAGDATGASLAAALCLIARDRKGPAIAFQLLLCPILDVHDVGMSRHEGTFGDGLDGQALRRDLELYCPGIDLSDPHMSPLLAENLFDLPPAFIHVGEFDPFRDDGLAYAMRLQQAGVPSTGRVHRGVVHHFYCMPRMAPYAHAVMQSIGVQIRDAVNLPLQERRSPIFAGPELIRA
jgi:acetyl esterase/lipase